MIITSNSPSAGYVAWQDVVIKHKNLSYTINNGNSNKKYIWWDFSLAPTALQESDTMPTLTDNDAIIIYNDSGTYHLMIDTDIHGGFLIDGTVTAIKLEETYVETTGNESIAGIKTFTDIPILPSDNPSTDFQATHKSYVDSAAPAAHHTTHENGGSDQIRIDNLQEGEDNTDLDSSVARHGLLRKLTNEADKFLDASGNWAAGGGGVTDHGALTGLADDDHSAVYLGKATNNAYTPTLAYHPATKNYVDETASAGGGVAQIIGAFVFTVPDTLASGNNKTLELFAGADLTITEVYISVKTAPTGASLIVDVNKGGTTIFTNQANRPEIAISGYNDTSGTPDVTALAKNDKLTIDIDQVGSTIAGEDLTVMVRCTQMSGGTTTPQAHKDTHDPQDGSDKLDCAIGGNIDGVQVAAEGSSHSLARADHAHRIQHGIADNAIVTVDHVTPVATDYARFTANGLEGREKSEVLSDLNVADGADVTGSNAPQAHKASHEDGGSDEIDITGLVGHQYGKNLILNQSFESYNIDTNLPDFWALSNTPTLVIAADTLFPARGGNQITITAVGAINEGIFIQEGATNWLKVLPSTKYTVSFDYKVTAGDELTVQIYSYNGAAAGTAHIDEEVTSTDAIRKTYTFTTDADADNLVIGFLAKNDGDIVIVSHLKLEQGALATPYIPPDRDRTCTRTEATNATPDPHIASRRNVHIITALGAAALLSAPTGTKYDGDVLIFRILDNSTGRALTYNAIYRGVIAALPDTTTAGKELYMGFIYNLAATKFDMLALAELP